MPRVLPEFGELEIVPPMRWISLPLLTAEEVLVRDAEARRIPVDPGADGIY